MKNCTRNKAIKRISLILVIIMMFNFTMPNLSRAANNDEGGTLFAPIAALLRGIGDLTISFVQKIFLGDGQISTMEETTLEEVDNMVNTEEKYLEVVKSSKSFEDLIDKLFEVDGGYIKAVYDGTTGAASEPSKGDVKHEVKKWLKEVTGENKTLTEWEDEVGSTEWENIINGLEKSDIELLFTDYQYLSKVGRNDTYDGPNNGEVTYTIKYGPGLIFSGKLPIFDINFINPEHPDDEDSSAVILQSTVSRWYQDIQKIALVGLLSVLVYIAIRIILASTGKDKAKYKKILMNWLVAVCIIFIIHYLMLFILNITGSITDMLSASAVETTEDGEYIDSLMTDLRQRMGYEENYKEIYADLIMYMALIIFTVMFTIQYLKRVIYMAFLTLIAPLIALTYPLDKIKDGQAQAFSMWIREYIFNALIQSIHLLLYVILVGTATELVAAYPLYGVVAIGFLVPAEKFFRSMFGFDKADSVGTLGAAAGGAVVMNAINKMKSMGPKGKSGSGAGGSENSNIKRSGGDPLEGLRNRNAGASGSNASTAEGSSDTSNVRQADNTTFAQTDSSGSPQTQAEEKKKRDIKGIAEKSAKNATRKVLRFTGRAAGTLALGSVGLAAGVTTGDLSKAFTYGIGGATVGGAVGKNLGDAAYNLPDSIRTASNKFTDTWNEGAYGKEYAQNVRFDREFMASEDGKRLVKSYSEGQVQQCLSAGITDAKQIEKILKNGGGSEASLKEAIGYSYLAEKCPDSVLYGNDVEAMRTFLTSRNLSVGNDDDVRSIQKKMADMKL